MTRPVTLREISWNVDSGLEMREEAPTHAQACGRGGPVDFVLAGDLALGYVGHDLFHDHLGLLVIELRAPDVVSGWPP
ncbi:hypothetical protein H2C43_05660 [Corynebacterium glutamicum]|uniref:hypothetical protein n=1 Tax=Corynebacterium glutamicum TaxID=1718 RepID=UPI0015EEF1BB|nr:hypothetical protein [Corynebacterium glutamicum]MBA4593423.1 hypothetical protein [Corynebacterium glutamicum]